MKKKLLWAVVVLIYGALFILLAVKKGWVITGVALFSLLICLPATITLHELGHVLVSYLCGFQVSVIYLGPWTILKRNGRWHVEFKLFYHPSFFGRVMVENPPIRDLEAYKRVARRWACISGAGPVVSVFWGIVGLVISYNVAGEYLSLFFTLFGFSSLGIAGATLLFGDGIHVFLFLTDLDFATLILSVYNMYSNLPPDAESNRFVNSLLLARVKSLVGEDLTDKKFTYPLTTHAYVLYLFLAGEIDQLPEGFVDSLEYIASEREKLLANRASRKLVVGLYHVLIIYWVVYEGKKELARELYGELVEKVDHSSQGLIYDKKRSEYFLGIADHYEFLMDEANMDLINYKQQGFYRLEKRISSLDWEERPDRSSSVDN